MAIAYRSIRESDFTTATASPWPIMSPGGKQPGDVMLMWIVTNTTVTVADGPINGWTRLVAGNFGTDGTCSLWWKIVEQNENAMYQMLNVFGGSSAICDIVIIVYSGVSYPVPSPINTSAGVTSTTGTAISGPSVSPSVDNCMIVQFAGTDPSTDAYTGTPDSSPVGVERWDAENSGGSSYEYIFIQEYLQGAKEAIALDATALTSDDYGHAQVALNPAVSEVEVITSTALVVTVSTIEVDVEITDWCEP